MREKRLFQPIQKNRVHLYVCGMTVYDYCHLGHARLITFFDIVYRLFRYLGYDMHYVRNITDIDDKIIQRATERGISITQLTDEMTLAMQEDFARLGNLAPNEEPRATTHITQMIGLIQPLLDNEFAYRGKNGDIYYAVKQFESYGQLSNRQLEDLQAGARIDVDPHKRDPLDFVLWKSAKPDEPSWPSPWGFGRPGWHIECSAMARHCLHGNIDLHGGGIDLLFPHHENEIAQSEGVSPEKPFANYWMHVGFLQIQDRKMSKSIGNVLTIRSLLERYAGETIRYFLLTTHYRAPFQFTEEGLGLAHAALERLYTAIAYDDIVSIENDADMQAIEDRFLAALQDDFNVPLALPILFELAHEIHRSKENNPAIAQRYRALLKKLGGVLGFLQISPSQFLKRGLISAATIDEAWIERLISERLAAREAREWQRADEIRQQLAAAGIILEDAIESGKPVTSWRRL